MTSADQAARLGPSDFQHLLTVGGRLFETEAQTPCRAQPARHTSSSEGRDLWFSPLRDREQAARLCQDCPFLGRCGYNAVVSRATHGVWGGHILPGDKPGELEPIYALLAQFHTPWAFGLSATWLQVELGLITPEDVREALGDSQLQDPFRDTTRHRVLPVNPLERPRE